MYTALLLASGMAMHDDGDARERRADTNTKFEFRGLWGGTFSINGRSK